MSEAERAITESNESSPGRAMALAREARNMTTTEVALRLKFGARQIEALEADDYARLPGVPFVRGMIRSYAKLLQIDAEPLLAAFGRRHIPSEVTVDLRAKKVPFPDGNKRSSKVYAVLTVALLLAVAAVMYEWRMHPIEQGGIVFVAPSKPEAQSTKPLVTPLVTPAASVDAAPAAVKPVVAATKPATAIPTASANQPATGLKHIQIEFLQESWVEIKQADGRTLLAQLNAGGTRQAVEGMPPFEIVIGNAPSVRLKYDGELVDLRPYFKVDVARLTLE